MRGPERGHRPRLGEPVGESSPTVAVGRRSPIPLLLPYEGRAMLRSLHRCISEATLTTSVQRRDRRASIIALEEELVMRRVDLAPPATDASRLNTSSISCFSCYPWKGAILAR